MKLTIAQEISFPIDAVTQTFAAIGRKGAGKTYLATMMAEQMLDNEAQVIAIDPVGVWWGLRVAADGKSKGKEIFVIGGEHGDVPLVPEAGAKIAKLLVEKGVSAVIDISSFRLGERKRFSADFGEELFHLKKSRRTPVHIFIEEAQLVIPQRVGPEEARMVGAFEQIVRLGRNYGIGCTLVTQRPQSVNKEVLSQVECLCVLQVTGLHERKALEDWVQEVGADRTLIGELPGLERGEGYVWSPSWLRIYKRVHFATKKTFDASATPEVGKATKAASLSAVDVEQLKADMADVIAIADKDNPVALRKKIVELQKHKCPIVQKNPVKVERIEIPMVGKRALEGLKKSESSIRKMLKATKESVQIMETSIAKLSGDLAKVSQPTKLALPQAIKPNSVHVIPHKTPIVENNGEITGPEQRILNAIAWLDSIGNPEPEQTAVAFLAGYTFGGGGFNNPKGALKSKNLVNYLPGNKIALTDTGREIAQAPETPLTTEELHSKVLSILPAPEQRLLRPLLEAYPNAMTNEELAEKAAYAFGSGGFNNPKGRLRSLGLVEYLPGHVKARSILFL